MGGEGEPVLSAWWLMERRYLWVTYHQGDEFVISADGREVWCSLHEDGDPNRLGLYLSGPIAVMVLRVRGTPCLHACAVNIEGKAAIFAGPSRRGKSTTAAAFAQRGHAVLSEDAAALSHVEGEVMVWPGPTQIRLWPDSASSLFGAEEALPRLLQDWDKRYLDVRGDSRLYQRSPLPVGGIFFLEPREPRAEAPRTQRLGQREAMMRLIGNTHGSWIPDKEGRRAEFDLFSHLARSVPCYSLTPHADIDRIDETCDGVLDAFAVE